MQQERTSKKVAAIAGKVLTQLDSADYDSIAPIYAMNRNSDLFLLGINKDYLTVRDLKALAASALTQSPDKKKPAKRKEK